MPDKLKPELRFPEFEEEWKISQLGKIGEINPSSKDLPEEFKYIDLESVIDGNLVKEETILLDGAPSRAQRLLNKKDVIFQMVRPYQKNNLYFNRDGQYVASTGYAQIRAYQDSKYLYQYLHYQKFVDKVIERCTGTSYPAINSSDLAKIPIYLPPLPEQTKIANFLSTVDEKIRTLTKKKTLLEEYKKGVMQRLFSQEIRFKDDQGQDFPDWEQKRLGDEGTFFSGGTPKSTNRSFYDGEIPFIKSGELNSTETEQFLSEIGFKKSSAKMVRKGDLLFALYGATSGECAISKVEGAINQAVLCIRSNFDNYFLLNFLKFNKENILSTYLQGGQGNLSGDTVKSLIIPGPSFAEQQKIANFLTALDEKITKATQQIETAQAFKRGFYKKCSCKNPSPRSLTLPHVHPTRSRS